MSDLPPAPPAGFPSAKIPVSKASSFAHLVADQGICSFLGRDFDLSFLASGQTITSVPLMTGSQTATNIDANLEIMEVVRIRLNAPSARHAAFNLLFALLQSKQMTVENARDELEKMAAQIPSDTTVRQ